MLVSETIPSKRIQASLFRSIDNVGLGQEIHKMNLEYFIIPESKEVFKKKKKWIMPTQHRSQAGKKIPVAKTGAI